MLEYNFVSSYIGCRWLVLGEHDTIGNTNRFSSEREHTPVNYPSHTTTADPLTDSSAKFICTAR